MVTPASLLHLTSIDPSNAHATTATYTQPNLALEAERAAVARMSYDEEIEHWEKVVLVESENDDKVKGEGKGAS